MADKIEIEVEVKDQTARQKIKKFNKEISALDKQIKKLGTNRVDEFFGDLSAQLSASENKLPQLKGALSGVNTQLAEMIKQYPDMKTMAAVAEKSAAFPEHIQSRLKGYGIPQEALDSYNQLLQKQAELKSAIGGTQNEIKNYKSMLADAGSTTTGSDNFDKQKAALGQLVQEQRDYLQGMSDMSQVSNEYIVNAVAGISRLKTEMEDLKTVGKTFGTNIYDEDFQNLHALEQELKHYKAELIKEAPLPKYLQEYVDDAKIVSPKIAEMVTRLKELKQQQKEMEQAGLGLGTKQYDDTLREIRLVSNALKDYKKELMATSAAKPKIAVWEKLSSIFKNISSAIRGLGSKIVSALASPFRNMNKSLDGFNKRLKTAILQGLIFRQVRSSLQKLVQGMNELTVANTQVSNSFAQVKGAAITAFQPVLTALIPIIQKVCSWLIILIQYISALLNLFGFIGKASKSAAKDMSNQAKATGAAAKANDKFLASWDTIQQVQKKSSGGGGADGIEPSFDFDDAGVEEKLDWLKKKLALDDWYGIGMEIAKKLNDLLSTFTQWFNAKFTPWILEASKDAADLLNGLFDGFSATELATTFTSVLNTALASIYVFLTTADWTQLGLNIAETIRRINWESIFSNVADDIAAIFKATMKVIGGLFGLDKSSFASLTRSLNKFKTALKNLSDIIVSKLGEAYKKVLKPLAKWTIEKAVPVIVDILSAALNALAWVLNKIDPKLIAGIVVAVLAFKAISAIPAILDAFSIAYSIFSKLLISSFAGLTSGIGPIIALIGALVSGLTVFFALDSSNLSNTVSNINSVTGAINDNTQSLRDNIDNQTNAEANMQSQIATTQSLAARLEELNSKSSLTNEEYGEMQGIIARLNDLYPDLNLQLSEQTGHLNLSNEELQKYIDKLLEEYKTEALKDQIIQLYKDQADAVENVRSAYDNQKNAANELRDAEDKLNNLQAGDNVKAFGASGTASDELNKKIKSLKDAYTNSAQATKDAADVYDEVSEKLKTVTSELSSVYKSSGEESGNNFSTGFINGLNEKDSVAEAQKQATNVLGGFNDGLGERSPSKYTHKSGIYFVEGFYNGVTEKLSNVNSWMNDNVGNKVMNAFNTSLGIVGGTSTTAKKSGVAVATGLSTGIGDNVHLATDKIDTWYNTTKTTTLSSGSWLSIGAQCVNGFMDGLNSSWEKITGWGQTLIDKIKGVLGIHSPSKEFAEIGRYSVWGFLKGLEDKKDFLVEFFSDLLLIVFNNVKDVLVKKVNDLLNQSSENIDSFLSITTKKVTETSKNIILQIYAVINALNAIPRYILTVHEIRTMQTDGGSLNSVAKVAATRVSAGVASLPHFAQGAVVNPGRQFEAILGDNRVEQEVVSPLSTMKEAFIEALQQSGYNRGGKIVMEMDGKVFAKVANPYFEKENSRIGIKAVGGI